MRSVGVVVALALPRSALGALVAAALVLTRRQQLDQSTLVAAVAGPTRRARPRAGQGFLL